MILFIYDEKHEAVNGQLDLGKISSEDDALLSKVTSFLEENGITDRYKRLVLADSYEYKQDEEGERTVEFK